VNGEQLHDQAQVELEAVNAVPFNAMQRPWSVRWREKSVPDVRHIFHIGDGNLDQ